MESRTLPPGSAANPRTVPKDDRAAPRVRVRARDSFDWSEAEMAFAGAAFAAVLFGAGLLVTLREAQRMV